MGQLEGDQHNKKKRFLSHQLLLSYFYGFILSYTIPKSLYIIVQYNEPKIKVVDVTIFRTATIIQCLVRGKSVISMLLAMTEVGVIT